MERLASLSRNPRVTIGIVVFSLLLYAVGLKWPLVVTLVWAIIWFVPVSSSFKSLASRSVFAIFMLMSLLQVAGLVQYIVLPNSSFLVLAIITTMLVIIVSALLRKIAPKRDDTPMNLHVWDRLDSFVVVAVFCSILPFTPIIVGNDSYLRIAEIGGLQAIDGINHYLNISDLTNKQHLDYKPNYYYPKGFHLSYAFIQDSIVGQPASLGWSKNVILFFVQYLIMMAALVSAVYYLALTILWRLSSSIPITSLQYTILTVMLGVFMAIFYSAPLMINGFLNYYYVIAAIALGAVMIIGMSKNNDLQNKWYSIVLFTFITFGAGMSWPLVIPLLIGLVCVALIPQNLGNFSYKLPEKTAIIFGCLFIFVMLDGVLIYYQIAYADPDPTKGINATGSLNSFHLLAHIASVLGILALVYAKRLNTAIKDSLLSVYVPVAGFVMAIGLYQYFTTGEVRYYVIKLAILGEIIFIALLVATIAHGMRQSTHKMALVVVLMSIIAVSLLYSYPNGPFYDLRNLFRDAAHQVKPDFYDHDVSLATKLGREQKITHNNIVVLHYDIVKNKIYGHEQIAYWVGGMQYDGTREQFAVLNTAGQLYSNLSWGKFTDAEQQAAYGIINNLADSAHAHHVPLYVITDQSSAEYLKKTLTNKNIHVIY